MSGEQEFLQIFVPSLEQQLLAAGLSGVSFGLVGYGNSAVVPRTFTINGQLLGSSADWVTAASGLEVSGGTEDGYAGIQHVLSNYTFAAGANTAVIVLVTDEDRDDTNNALTFQVILTNLQNANASLAGIIDQAINGPGGEPAIGTNGTITYIDANNDGVPEELGAPAFGAADGTTNADYTQLILSFEDGCVADINQLRAGGTTAQAFAVALARCLVRQALGGSGRDHFLNPPSVVSRLAMLRHADTLLFRLSGRHGGFDGGAYGAQAEGSNAARTRRSFALLSYTDGMVDPTVGQPGFDFDGVQLVIGFDADVNENTLLGFSIGYTDGDSTADDRDDTWEHRVTTLAMHASSKFANDMHLDAVASVGVADYKTRRAVLGGQGAEAATAAPEGSLVGARVRLGRTYALFGDAVQATPHIGANYSRVTVDGYDESGPGAVTVSRYAHEVTTIDFGVDAQSTHETQWGKLRPSLQLGVEYAAIANDETVRVRTALGGGFEQSVPALDEWTGVLGLGASLLDEEKGTAIRFGYEGRFGDELEVHSLAVRGRMRF